MRNKVARGKCEQASTPPLGHSSLPASTESARQTRRFLSLLQSSRALCIHTRGYASLAPGYLVSAPAASACFCACGACLFLRLRRVLVSAPAARVFFCACELKELASCLISGFFHFFVYFFLSSKPIEDPREQTVNALRLFRQQRRSTS